MSTALMLCALMQLVSCTAESWLSPASSHPSSQGVMSKSAQGPRDLGTHAGVAGQPVPGSQSQPAAGKPPSDEELDQRDQMLAFPRPQAGPPLLGDASGL